MASVIIAGNARPNPPVSSIVGSRLAAYDPATGSRVSRANPATMGAKPATSITTRSPNRAISRAD
jgi:hypothetical protein